MIISLARPSPTTLGRREQPPTSGISPTRVSTSPIAEFDAIVRRSQASASSIAPPMHPPCIWAIVGLAISSQRFHVDRIAPRVSRSRWGLSASEPSEPMSIPAENIAPAPRTTTHLTDESSAAARSAAPSPAISSSFIALRFCGRFITTWRTGPRSSVITMLMAAPGEGR